MSLSAKRDSKGAGCRSLEHTSEASSTPKEHAPVDPWSERQADKEEGFSNLPRKRSSLTTSVDWLKLPTGFIKPVTLSLY